VINQLGDNEFCWPAGFAVDHHYDSDEHFEPSVNHSINADVKMMELIDHVNNLSLQYQGNHVLVPFGCDYSFTNASLNF